MKKLLIGILTLFITIAIMLLGFSMNIKTFVVDTVDAIVKKEVTDDISDYIGKMTGQEPQEVKKGIDKVLNENNTIKKIADDYFDKVIDVMMGKDAPNINIAKDLEEVINSNEKVLKEYGIILSESAKKELLDYVGSEEVNDTFNETLNEFKGSMPSEIKTSVEIFNFIRSTTFKLILIGGIILFLVLIAVLKKSPYKWLINLGESCLVSGIVMGILIPFAIDIIEKEIADKGIVLSSSAFSTYGYISMGIGIGAIILNIVISKIIKNKKIIEN